MKVLLIITSSRKVNKFPPNNYNVQELGIIRAFNKLGYTCDIAVYSDNYCDCDVIRIDGFSLKIYYLKGFDVLKNSFFKRYNHIYDSYDVLIPISYDHFETYHIAMMYPQKTIVYTGTYYSKFNKLYNLKCFFIDKFFIPGYIRSNTLFVTKNTLSVDFLRNKGIKNIFPLGVGLDTRQLGAESESDLSKKMLMEKNSGTKLLLYIGRIENRRNILFLIEVFNIVQKKENVKLILIGKGKENYINKCKELIKKYGISDKIIHIDNLEQKYLSFVYKRADVFCFPSSYDIFGMVLLESMYFGTPVLSSLNGGADILIKNNENGFVLPNFDEKQWSEKIIEILHSDNKRIINNAKNKIEREFTWDCLINKLLLILKIFFDNSRIA